MKGSLILSWGSYGGFYVINSFSKRVCLGWIAFTYIPEDIDNLLY